MTLKKCTTRQFDEMFWRVDWEGSCAQHVAAGEAVFSPCVVAFYDGEYRFLVHPGLRARSIDALLRDYSLTRHPKPETAEERVRRAAGLDRGYLDDVPALDDATVGDLRAVLAELDQARSDRDRHKDAAVEFATTLGVRNAELDRLRAQRPVDTGAVLVPVRKIRERMAQEATARKDAGDSQMVDPTPYKLALAVIEHAEGGAYENASEWLGPAIAEAEKIGGVEK